MARTTRTGLATVIALCWLTTPAAAQDPKASKPAATPKAPAKAPTKPPATKAAPKADAKAAPSANDAPDSKASDAKALSGRSGEAAAKGDVPECPPGAFCEQQEVAPTEPRVHLEERVVSDEAETEQAAAQGGTVVTLPPAAEDADPNKPRTFTYIPDPDGGPGQLIIYEDGAKPPHLPGQRVHKGARSMPPPPPAPSKKRRLYRNRRWGLNLRVDGAILPKHRNTSADVGMAGGGLSLRYRPVPAFAFDVSADFMAGHDSQGFARQEIPIGLSGIIYVNPRSLAQFYLMGGINWSFARVGTDDWQPNLADRGYEDAYTYFGGHGGMGLEFRVSPLIGINIDGLAFVRGRTDDDGDGLYPEYLDQETGETSNTSVAGLLRAGVTFWW